MPTLPREESMHMDNKRLEKSRKYETSGMEEDRYEPGSKGRVLKNILGVMNKREMDRIEYDEQMRALIDLTEVFGIDHRFKAKDICRMHKVWLGRVYSWAGRYRNVNITKGGFPFAAAHAIPPLMKDLEAGPLKMFTPCRCDDRMEVIRGLAVVHTELVLIHPFREGNGRLARLLAVLMGLQAQLPTLDFGGLAGGKKREYFAAVRAGMSKNYQPMIKIFESVVKRTLRTQRGK